MPDEEYLTIQQISRRLNVSERTVRRWILEKGAEKKLPAIIIGTRYRVLPSDLQKFLDKHKK